MKDEQSIKLERSVGSTIMLADADDDNRCLIKSILELQGFFVVEATNGQEAVDLAVSRRPDLVLIDLKLPVVSGFTAIRRFKRDKTLRDIPIIAISFNRPDCHEKLALAAGCAAHLQKPIELDHLDVLIDRLLPGERWQLASVLVH
ncbi:MAG: response regulator [Acidobacteriota bacterium]